MGTWLDKLEWVIGVWEPESGKQILYRKADITPYYEQGMEMGEIGYIQHRVVLTEWPRNYTIDLVSVLGVGSEFQPEDMIEECQITRICKIPRDAILRQPKAWWKQQRSAIREAIAEFEPTGWRHSRREWLEDTKPDYYSAHHDFLGDW